jgi:hypothetical protein
MSPHEVPASRATSTAVRSSISASTTPCFAAIKRLRVRMSPTSFKRRRSIPLTSSIRVTSSIAVIVEHIAHIGHGLSVLGKLIGNRVSRSAVSRTRPSLCWGAPCHAGPHGVRLPPVTSGDFPELLCGTAGRSVDDWLRNATRRTVRYYGRRRQLTGMPVCSSVPCQSPISGSPTRAPPDQQNGTLGCC